ncbi:speriolin-like protein [Ranitomeya variabilis]|uniref:speriolin-like protein n=1 Tax=Ranitomeya variabilis TaxID=490064 RepID=UPI0040577024
MEPAAERTHSMAQDPEKVTTCQRIVGEIAFHLERWIICAIFQKQRLLYGYSVTTNPFTGSIDKNVRSKLLQCSNQTMNELKKMGYNPAVHPHFAEYLINTHGITRDINSRTEHCSCMNDPQHLNKMINKYMPSDKVKDIIIILNCLEYFKKPDGKPLCVVKPWLSYSSLDPNNKCCHLRKKVSDLIL